ncbi:MAG: hypothetical protein Q7S88_03575, partial [Candidatus Daviesbacteria bacterium]|nr:hypothetical protein [Candidatus Daviesbacteria bacterium]
MNKKLLVIILVLGVLTLLVLWSFYKPTIPGFGTQTKNDSSSQTSESKDPEVVSTIPSPLSGATILPTQIIEITFNKALHNKGEFKNKIEPKVEYEIQLSGDRKTAKIIPTKGWTL